MNSRRQRQTVTSSNGQLKLDYGRGLLTIDAPAAQGASGALAEGGKFELHHMTIESDMSLGHIVAVSLDGLPLKSSKNILLQVMSEEKSTGFQTEPSKWRSQKDREHRARSLACESVSRSGDPEAPRRRKFEGHRARPERLSC